MKVLIVLAELTLSPWPQTPAPLCSGSECVQESFLYQGIDVHMYEEDGSWRIVEQAVA